MVECARGTRPAQSLRDSCNPGSQLAHVVDNHRSAVRSKRSPVLRPAMTAAAEADRRHPGGARGIDASQTVLDHQAAPRLRSEPRGGTKKQIGCRLAPCDHCRAEQVFAKTRQEPCYLKFVPDLLRGAARRHANWRQQRIECLSNTRDGDERMTDFVVHR